ncbi:MAG: tRNA (guanosine(46)-N7)-methyltransferase TrmB [Cytophagales bacterium]|nr:tRNA (guanosine(46)-N7)-methyltransferase TrmB [Bernardetiaceae bacterium]MDW8211628.1 tRNA (guanosine(46)-N7)-methyltransferase TrmB [Cytophagales bacterium]
MGKSKLQRFADNRLAPNVIEPGKPLYQTIRGNWHVSYFHNFNPIVLELACGRGEYTVAFAEKYPDKNFIGVDIKGARIWKGSQICLRKGLQNAAFLRIQIQQIENFFASGEVSEIWLIHPDPRPKEGDQRRRLTHPRFLNHYRNIGKPGMWFHLRTDNAGLFHYTLEMLQNEPITDLAYTNNLYESPLLADHLDITGQPIRTKYEELFTLQGHTIHYLRCRLW